jgi:hypothetical protein
MSLVPVCPGARDLLQCSFGQRLVSRSKVPAKVLGDGRHGHIDLCRGGRPHRGQQPRGGGDLRVDSVRERVAPAAHRANIPAATGKSRLQQANRAQLRAGTRMAGNGGRQLRR